MPYGLLRLATEADEQIVQYRDQLVTHEQSPRTIRATMWSKDSSPSIHVGRIHPRDTDPEGVRSASPRDLMALIDEYLGTVLDWLAEWAHAAAHGVPGEAHGAADASRPA